MVGCLITSTNTTTAVAGTEVVAGSFVRVEPIPFRPPTADAERRWALSLTDRMSAHFKQTAPAAVLAPRTHHPIKHMLSRYRMPIRMRVRLAVSFLSFARLTLCVSDMSCGVDVMWIVDRIAVSGNPYEQRPTSLSVGASLPGPVSAPHSAYDLKSSGQTHRRGGAGGWFSTAPPTAFPEQTTTTTTATATGAGESCSRCRRLHPNSVNCPPLHHTHSPQLHVPYHAQYHAPVTGHTRSPSIPSPIPVDLTSLGSSGASANGEANGCCQRCEWKIGQSQPPPPPAVHSSALFTV